MKMRGSSGIWHDFYGVFDREGYIVLVDRYETLNLKEALKIRAKILDMEGTGNMVRGIILCRNVKEEAIELLREYGNIKVYREVL